MVKVRQFNRVEKVKIKGKTYKMKLLCKNEALKMITRLEAAIEIKDGIALRELLLSMVVDPKLDIDDFDTVEELDEFCKEIFKIQFGIEI